MDSRLNINRRGWRADFSWLALLESIVVKKFKFKGSISIALIDKKEIKELNRVYRRKDKVTDVLSFNLDSKELLGEIVICLDQAKKQAKSKKQTLKSELQLLTVHGILHLLGYNHELGPKDAAKQEEKQQEILALLR